MKKQYISPALTIHQINAEAMLLEASQRRMIDFGNQQSQGGAYIPDVEQYGIDVIEDDDDNDFEWGTI